MNLIIGLGNPGIKYQKTRHNTGFIILDLIAKKFNLKKFKHELKLKSDTIQDNINKHRVVLAKPQTFMNESGHAVGLIQTFYKIKPEHIIVIHDELDLPFGDIKISQSKSSAGHKGVESIIRAVGTKNFTRIRIGIKNKKQNYIPAEKFVLSRFSLIERLAIKSKILPQVITELEKLLK